MAIRIDRVYTRSGDDGSTGLVGGQRVGKDDLRIETYGTVDELNSITGMIRARIAMLKKKKFPPRAALLKEIQAIQQQLFNLGSELACPPAILQQGMPVVTTNAVTALERRMDAMSRTLKPLKSFILPGGGELSAWCHLARTVARRAERLCVALRKSEPAVRPETVHYLNRLSDYFFVLARWVARRAGEKEYLWDKEIL